MAEMAATPRTLRRVKPMTLLGAFQTDGRVLFLADGREGLADATGNSVYRETTKAWLVGNMPSIAWGFSGELGLGQRFRSWLDEQPPFDSWETLRDQCLAKLVGINGERVRRLQASGGGNGERIDAL